MQGKKILSVLIAFDLVISISPHTFGCKSSPIMSTGKVILVTGANRGLGYSILQVAGARDALSTFIMTSRKLEAGQEAAAKLVKEGVNAKIEVIPLDVTNDDQILAAVKYVEEKHGKLDGEPPDYNSWILQKHQSSLTTQSCANNAGIISIIKGQSLPELRRVTNEMLDVNLTSVAVISTAF
jgi:NAD(P)-dependent dehydrogenase (short-subunit alcohol dehydrogenase family)